MTNGKTHFSRGNFKSKSQYWICRGNYLECFCKETCSLRIWRNLQENFCAGVSFRLDTSNLKFIKKRLQHRCFPMNFAKKSFKNTFLTEHLWVASSESVSANGPEISFLWTECSDETLSIFWKKSILGKIKNLWNEITEKFFSFFQPSIFLTFVKIWTSTFTFYFWLINLWRNNEHFFVNY